MTLFAHLHDSYGLLLPYQRHVRAAEGTCTGGHGSDTFYTNLNVRRKWARLGLAVRQNFG